MAELKGSPSKCRLQNFSLPRNIIYYIQTVAKSAKLREKLIKVCKHFYLKNPIAAVKDLQRWHDDWTVTNFKGEESEELPHQIWILGVLNIYYCDDNNVIPTLIPRIFRCDLTALKLARQRVTFDEYSFLVSGGNVKDLQFLEPTIYDSEGVVPLERILEKVPTVKMVL